MCYESMCVEERERGRLCMYKSFSFKEVCNLMNGNRLSLSLVAPPLPPLLASLQVVQSLSIHACPFGRPCLQMIGGTVTSKSIPLCMHVNIRTYPHHVQCRQHTPPSSISHKPNHDNQISHPSISSRLSKKAKL